MSLFPAYFGKRPSEDAAPASEPENESRADVFNLIPRTAAEKYERPDKPEKAEKAEPIPVAANDVRKTHPLSTADLSRLSVDDDGRLYWDSKPVEVQRRLVMSRKQVVAATLITLCVLIAAAGTLLQAAASANAWTCRIGLTACTATAPSAPTPRPPALDIPA